MTSLRLRLLVIIGGSLVLLWSLVAAWMLLGLRGELRTALDDRLAASARMVAALATQFPPADLAQPGRAASMLDVVGRDGIACEVSLLRGELAVQKVARTGASPALDDAAPGYGTQVYGGKLWRTYVLQQGAIRVATADRIDTRESLMREVALAAAVPFVIALAGTLATLWFGIGRGLRPLERMRALLAARRADEDAPLPATPVPRELAPLVDTIARLLERVRGAIARERRFTDDAAHELRTPLTAVKTHLQVMRLALRKEAPGVAQPQLVEALDHADAGVVRMQHTLEQLLLLARLDGPMDTPAGDSCDAKAAARQAVRDAEAAQGASGRVRLEPSEACPAVAVPEALLASALRNLLDNALRVAPPGSPVLLRLEAAGSQVRFTVLDEGPGMSEADCALATRRFWRRPNGGPGSGLGLAIVSSIAGRYGGALTLAPRDGGGLCARLALPALTQPNPGCDAPA